MYKSVVPLTVERHKTKRLKDVTDYRFARDQTMCPVTATEFPRVATCYPIVFLKDDVGDLGAFALLAMPQGRNLFVDDKGAWMAFYIPASIRRYPFAFGRKDKGTKEIALCIDEESDVVSDDEGVPLFTDDGKPAERLEKTIEFMKQTQASQAQTVAICQELENKGMFQELNAQVRMSSGQQFTFTGAKIINEKKLETVSDLDFLEWRKRGWLTLIYSHLVSLGQITHLAELHEKSTAGNDPDAGESPVQNPLS